MPRYCFECECGNKDEFFAPIKDGPPKKVICEKCSEAMYQEFGGHFILKGDNWAGKEASRKQDDYNLAKATEETDVQLAEDDRNQRIVEDVTKTRRKGRKATDSLKRNRPQKWDDYTQAMSKGYRPKQKKSYEIKAMKE